MEDSVRGGEWRWGCGAEGNFAAKVGAVGIRGRILEQFFDDGQEVVKGADGSGRQSVGRAADAAGRGEQESGFDQSERDLAIPELADQPKVEATDTARGFIGVHGAHQVGREGVDRKGRQMGAFWLEELGDGARIVSRPGAEMSDLVAPLEGLTIEVGQGGKGAGSEEAVTHILNGALDASLFISAGRVARASGKVIVSGEFQQVGMEVDGIAATLQDHTFQMVIEYAARRSCPIIKGMDMVEEEVFQSLVEEELQP